MLPMENNSSPFKYTALSKRKQALPFKNCRIDTDVCQFIAYCITEFKVVFRGLMFWRLLFIPLLFIPPIMPKKNACRK